MGGNEMNADKLSVRQLAVCAFLGGLAPAAAGAGYGWQGMLLAVPVLLLAGWGLALLAPRWNGMERKWTGKVLSALYALWGAALLGRGLERCAGRILQAGGADPRYSLWLLALLTLPLLWMAGGKPAAFFRAAEIFYLAVAVAGTALLVWGVCKINWTFALLPAENFWGGFWAALETGGIFLFAIPCLNRAAPEKNGSGRALKWLSALAAACVLLSLVTVGVLSPAVAGSASEPFFLMTATLGRAVRVEGLASAVWLLSDFAYLGLLARSWQRTGSGRSWLPPLAVLFGAVCAALGLPDLLAPAIWGWGSAILAGVTAAALLCAGKS